MLNIITVCTGNICRSPLAELVLRARLGGLNAQVTSAGTRAQAGAPVTPETARLAAANGSTLEQIASHTASLLTEPRLRNVDLALAMSREHRRAIVELSPSLTRRTFTVRELSRLVDGLDDSVLLEAASAASDSGSRLAAMVMVVASRRGTTIPPSSPEADDVIDPYRRSERVYDVSAAQIFEALPAVERLARLALSG